MISTPGTALLTTRSLMSAQSFDGVSPGDARGGYGAFAPRSPTIIALGIACFSGHPSQVTKPTLSTGPMSLKASYPSFYAGVRGPREPILRHHAATSTVLVPPGPWQSQQVAGREVLSVAGLDERVPGDPSRNTCSSKVLSGTSRCPGDRGPLPHGRSAMAFMTRTSPSRARRFTTLARAVNGVIARAQERSPVRPPCRLSPARVCPGGGAAVLRETPGSSGDDGDPSNKNGRDTGLDWTIPGPAGFGPVR